MQEELEVRTVRQERRRNRILTAVIVVLSLLVALTVTFFLVKHFKIADYYVDGESMQPTLDGGITSTDGKTHIDDGDKVYVWKGAGLKKGDIIVFNYHEKVLIKRVIAVGGDSIEIRTGALYVNSRVVEENYIKEPMPATENLSWRQVPEGQVFVMGDNRGNSDDSRRIGFVSLEKVIGKVFLLTPAGTKRLAIPKKAYTAQAQSAAYMVTAYAEKLRLAGLLWKVAA